jgi:cysteinyl-tRNA synthetase
MSLTSGRVKQREIKLFNTLTQKKEVLQTLEPGRLRMYSCGPTVYGFIHIGNLRAVLTSDLFFRYFKRAGYDVNYVRNYTDVDDKIIQKANEEKTTQEAIAKRYTQEAEKDFALAGLEEPTHKTTVTGHMAEIVAMIEKLIQKKHAYVVDGEVLYAIESFPHYGELAHRKADDLQAVARVEINEKKKNPLDFALWKPAKPGEPSWPSPWAAGRPGWHIECSAMACKHLGDQMDVHHGGEDLVFPHHENEIAQSEGATGKAPFVRYWLHHAFINMSKQKMSKSLGNVLLARDFLAQFGGEFARAMILSVHYRSILDFAEESIDQTLHTLERLYDAKKKANELKHMKSAMPDPRGEQAWGSFAADIQKAKQDIDDAFANDFNTPDALARLFTLIREFNRVSTEFKAQTPAAILAATELVHLIEVDIGGVMGIGRTEPERMLKQLSEIRSKRPMESGLSRPTAEEVQSLIEARLQARKDKNFARADEIRQDLQKRGVILKDGPSGTTWTYS